MLRNPSVAKSEHLGLQHNFLYLPSQRQPCWCLLPTCDPEVHLQHKEDITWHCIVLFIWELWSWEIVRFLRCLPKHPCKVYPGISRLTKIFSYNYNKFVVICLNFPLYFHYIFQVVLFFPSFLPLLSYCLESLCKSYISLKRLWHLFPILPSNPIYNNINDSVNFPQDSRMWERLVAQLFVLFGYL